jgi:hypothetical protein
MNPLLRSSPLNALGAGGAADRNHSVDVLRRFSESFLGTSGSEKQHPARGSHNGFWRLNILTLEQTIPRARRGIDMRRIGIPFKESPDAPRQRTSQRGRGILPEASS